MSPALIITFIEIFVIFLACYKPGGHDDSPIKIMLDMMKALGLLAIMIMLFTTIAISGWIAVTEPHSSAWMVCAGSIAAVLIIGAILERQQQI